MPFQLKRPLDKERLLLIVNDSLNRHGRKHYTSSITSFRNRKTIDFASNTRPTQIYSCETVADLLLKSIPGSIKDSLESHDGLVMEGVIVDLITNATDVYPTDSGIDIIFKVTLNDQDFIILLEIKSSHNFGNSNQWNDITRNLKKVARELHEQTGLVTIPMVGIWDSAPGASANDRKNRKGVQVWYGRAFWGLVTGYPEMYDLVPPLFGLYKRPWMSALADLQQIKFRELETQCNNVNMQMNIHQYREAFKPAVMSEDNAPAVVAAHS